MKLLAIDGNSIFNRAFYGIRLLTTKSGQYTNAIYGFLTILLKLLDNVSPDGVAIAFDMRAPTFRHKQYEGYKAQRKGMPPELASQLEPLKDILTSLGYRLLQAEGWEADDILGTLASACRKQGNECVIATGDRDSLQLVGGGVTVRLAATRQGRPEVRYYDDAKITEEYGVSPLQLIDIKALQGDASDNIPGVAGIGQKTASALIQQFGSLDGVYEHLDSPDIKPGVRAKLTAGKDSAYLSRSLGEIHTDAPVETAWESFVPHPAPGAETARLLARYELFSLIERMHLDAPAEQDIAAPQAKEAILSVREEDNFPALVARLRGQKQCYLLVRYENDTPAMIAVCEENGVTLLSNTQPDFEKATLSLLSDPSISLITHNAKPLYKYVLSKGREPAKVQADTEITAYLLNPSASGYDLSRLAAEYHLPLPTLPEGTADTALEAALLPAVWETLSPLLQANGQEQLFYEMELPLTRVLAEMELEGFSVNDMAIEAYGRELEAKLTGIRDSIYEDVGYEFNINSPKQLGEALFVKLGLPVRRKTKSGYSTDASVLESLRDYHPAISKILEFRTLSKLKSTYCDGLLKVTGPDGRIHTIFKQTETRTGRISSTEPNLQNIPVRTELGREFRRFFEAKAGCVLVDADYSQIELRVLAHIADDETMRAAFRDGVDIHRLTASQVFHMPPEMVTPLMRSRAKAVNFGIVYGIGAFSLAKDIGVSRREADEYIKGYLNTYSGVKRYMDRAVKDAKESGYCETIFGRRRYLPELSSSNANLRGFGERVAMNMPIQGTAADIIKLAMIRVSRRLKDEGLQSRLILQVHDELIVEAPQGEADHVAVILKEEMQHAAELSVPLEVDANTGATWYDAH
ncbi:MAG: DNA polymerase I [Clostridiales bacterium]|nr:DNA polymerase I [Clostridiales bacterium]